MDKKRRILARIIVIALCLALVLTTVLWAVQLSV